MKKIIPAIALAVMFMTGVKASVVTYNQGDTLLGFQALTGTGSSTNLVVDLGAFTVGQAINVSFNLNADLTAAYGSGWTNNSSLYWGVFGSDTINDIWASVAHQGTAWKSLGNGNSTPKANLFNAGSTYNADINAVPTQAGSVGVFEGIGETSSWNSYNPGGNAFAYTVSSTLNNGNINALLNQGLDVYSMGPTRSTVGTLVGILNLSTSGAVTTVPEPSTYALFGLGITAVLIGMRRRKLS
jgi:hypothetical protein